MPPIDLSNAQEAINSLEAVIATDGVSSQAGLTEEELRQLARNPRVLVLLDDIENGPNRLELLRRINEAPAELAQERGIDLPDSLKRPGAISATTVAAAPVAGGSGATEERWFIGIVIFNELFGYEGGKDGEGWTCGKDVSSTSSNSSSNSGTQSPVTPA